MLTRAEVHAHRSSRSTGVTYILREECLHGDTPKDPPLTCASSPQHPSRQIPLREPEAGVSAPDVNKRGGVPSQAF